MPNWPQGDFAFSPVPLRKVTMPVPAFERTDFPNDESVTIRHGLGTELIASVVVYEQSSKESRTCEWEILSEDELALAIPGALAGGKYTVVVSG